MTKILVATTNPEKFSFAQQSLEKVGLEAIQTVLDIDEIQGEDPETIIKDKASRAYELLGEPVLVTDDSWSFAGLRGFPGPYMKSINHWFTADDFARLISGLDDRLVTLQQLVAYQDEHECVVFRRDLTGQLVDKPRGDGGAPLQKVVIMDEDREADMTISEVIDAGEQHHPRRIAKRLAWDDFAEWYQEARSIN